MGRKIAKSIDLKNIKIQDGFFQTRQELILEEVIPYQEKILNDEMEGVEKSHAFANFRIAAGLAEGEFYGMVFQDSDVAKWLEAAAYSFACREDRELMKKTEEIIDTIEKAQQPDGYLNTYFTIKEPEHRWQNLLECHELYCAGHMMEAAAAYYETTGKDKLLKVMEKLADHIAGVFSNEKKGGIPGHQEIEIGLMRLFEVTGKKKYQTLAEYFINTRGVDNKYFVKEAQAKDWKHFPMIPEDTKYNQSHSPVREQRTAEGHSVRAVYMYTAMADIAGETGEEELFHACDTLFDNMTQKRMYLTGGIGSTVHGEAFTIDYDLPNDTAYAETCAAIGLIFFTKKMLDIAPCNKYADVMETALYNAVLCGMQLDGKRFFYVNPLEVNPGVSGVLEGYRHVLPTRPQWYACACCPPNVSRLLTSLGKYLWSEGKDTIYSHLYIGNRAELEHAVIHLESEYPWEGRARYTISPKTKEEFTIAIRIPSYAKEVHVLFNGKEVKEKEWQEKLLSENGYYYWKRQWKDQDSIEIIFDMPVRKIYCNTNVRENAGCAAFKRGPLVYCFEEIDNKKNLHALRVGKGNVFVGSYEKQDLGGIRRLYVPGKYVTGSDMLYSEQQPVEEDVTLCAVPYYAWGNRGINGMRVWMLEESER